MRRDDAPAGPRRLEGFGLHRAKPASVSFARCEGPSTLNGVTLEGWVPAPSERSTAIARGEDTLATVEHLFAAVAALRAFDGLAITVEGPEVPLLDGGARAFVDAIGPIAPAPPRLVVARDSEIVVGDARYAFRRAEGVLVEVVVDFGDERLAPRARWEGDAEDFRARVATARTFGFEREVEMLLARGLASHVSPESVVVLGESRVLSAGRPFTADEPARHKLLDLIGDLGVHGGPPMGHVEAVRPGHASTHDAVARAIAEGALVRARDTTL